MNADACNSHIRAIYMNADSCIFGARLCNAVIRKEKRSAGRVVSPIRALQVMAGSLARGSEVRASRKARTQNRSSTFQCRVLTPSMGKVLPVENAQTRLWKVELRRAPKGNPASSVLYVTCSALRRDSEVGWRASSMRRVVAGGVRGRLCCRPR